MIILLILILLWSAKEKMQKVFSHPCLLFSFPLFISPSFLSKSIPSYVAGSRSGDRFMSPLKSWSLWAWFYGAARPHCVGNSRVSFNCSSICFWRFHNSYGGFQTFPGMLSKASLFPLANVCLGTTSHLYKIWKLKAALGIQDMVV